MQSKAFEESLERVRTGGKVIGLMQAQAIALELANEAPHGSYERDWAQRVAAKIEAARDQLELLDATANSTPKNDEHNQSSTGDPFKASLYSLPKELGEAIDFLEAEYLVPGGIAETAEPHFKVLYAAKQALAEFLWKQPQPPSGDPAWEHIEALRNIGEDRLSVGELRMLHDAADFIAANAAQLEAASAQGVEFTYADAIEHAAMLAEAASESHALGDGEIYIASQIAKHIRALAKAPPQKLGEKGE